MKPNVNQAAIFEWLDRTHVREIRAQLDRPDELAKALSEYYQDPDEYPDPECHPDSQEAAEAATVDEERIEAAARTWGRLTEDERTRLRRLLEEGFDVNPDHLAGCFEDLDLNMPWDPDPDEDSD